MHTSSLCTLILLLSSVAPPSWAGFDHDDIKRLREAGDILALETIISTFRADQPGGRLLETELDYERGRYIYELELLDDDGHVRELYYDARSGERLPADWDDDEDDEDNGDEQ